MSIPASKRIEIMLHRIKGQLEYEQNSQILTQLRPGAVSVSSEPVEWGPRMRELLEEDHDLLIDWLCEIGVLMYVGGNEYRRAD